jgi:hypothetical protein
LGYKHKFADPKEINLLNEWSKHKPPDDRPPDEKP